MFAQNQVSARSSQGAWLGVTILSHRIAAFFFRNPMISILVVSQKTHFLLFYFVSDL
jgi:hypothetical protein